MDSVQFALSEESMRGLEALRGDIARLMRMITTAQMVPDKSGEALESIQKAYRDEVAKRVHGERSRSGTTLEALADMVRLPIRMLEHIENGSYVHVSGAQLVPIAKALGIHPRRIDPEIDDAGRIVPLGKEYNMGGYERPLYPPRGKSDGETEGPD